MQVSLLCPYAVQSIPLPEDTGAVRDLHFSPADAVLPGRLALLASLGKKLSAFRWPFSSFSYLILYNSLFAHMRANKMLDPFFQHGK